MNRKAYYTYKLKAPNTVYGPHQDQADAEKHASAIGGVVTLLTGNDIQRSRIRLVAPRVTQLHEHAYGQRVRWKTNSDMRAFAGNVVGKIVPQPVGAVGIPADGGVYVLWAKLKEPMACFLYDLEPYTA